MTRSRMATNQPLKVSESSPCTAAQFDPVLVAIASVALHPWRMQVCIPSATDHRPTARSGEHGIVEVSGAGTRRHADLEVRCLAKSSSDQRASRATKKVAGWDAVCDVDGLGWRRSRAINRRCRRWAPHTSQVARDTVDVAARFRQRWSRARVIPPFGHRQIHPSAYSSSLVPRKRRTGSIEGTMDEELRRSHTSLCRPSRRSRCDRTASR